MTMRSSTQAGWSLSRIAATEGGAAHLWICARRARQAVVLPGPHLSHPAAESARGPGREPELLYEPDSAILRASLVTDLAARWARPSSMRRLRI